VHVRQVQYLLFSHHLNNKTTHTPPIKAAKVLVMSEKGKRQLCESAAAREKECPSLNVWKLRQLLTMYTPDEGEQKLSLSVLSKLFSSTSTNEGK
jgi:hypothetical protein